MRQINRSNRLDHLFYHCFCLFMTNCTSKSPFLTRWDEVTLEKVFLYPFMPFHSRLPGEKFGRSPNSDDLHQCSGIIDSTTTTGSSNHSTDSRTNSNLHPVWHWTNSVCGKFRTCASIRYFLQFHLQSMMCTGYPTLPINIRGTQALCLVSQCTRSVPQPRKAFGLPFGLGGLLGGSGGGMAFGYDMYRPPGFGKRKRRSVPDLKVFHTTTEDGINLFKG